MVGENDEELIILGDEVSCEVVILGDGDVGLLVRYNSLFRAREDERLESC